MLSDKSNLNQSTMSTYSVAPERAQQNRVYYVAYRICTHWSFTIFITVLIIANTAVLALDQYPANPATTNVAELMNEFFTWAFVAEMIIKLMGLGFREYTRDSFNIFDALIVILSMIDFIMSAATPAESQSGSLSAFRGVRLLRVFKLARSWHSFREILAKIIVTMKDVSTFSVLLLMFMFIFTLLGMELFGHKVRFDGDFLVHSDEEGGESPRPNFDNLGMGFTSIFAVAIGDDWNYFMAQAHRAEGGIAIAFYPFVFIFMNLILLNLFLAILLQNFETKEDEQDQKKGDFDQDEKVLGKWTKRLNRSIAKCTRCCASSCSCFYFKEEDENSDSENNDDQDDYFDSFRKSNIVVEDLTSG